MFTETDQPRAGPCGPAGREAPDAELRPAESVTNALGQDLIELDNKVEDHLPIGYAQRHCGKRPSVGEDSLRAQRAGIASTSSYFVSFGALP